MRVDGPGTRIGRSLNFVVLSKPMLEASNIITIDKVPYLIAKTDTQNTFVAMHHGSIKIRFTSVLANFSSRTNST